MVFLMSLLFFIIIIIVEVIISESFCAVMDGKCI